MPAALPAGTRTRLLARFWPKSTPASLQSSSQLGKNQPLLRTAPGRSDRQFPGKPAPAPVCTKVSTRLERSEPSPGLLHLE